MSSGFQDRVNAISLVIRDGNGFGSPLGPIYVYAVGETPTTFSNLQCHITVSRNSSCPFTHIPCIFPNKQHQLLLEAI